MTNQTSVEIIPNEISTLFTGEQTLVDRVAEEIAACWHKFTEGILNLARACAAADAELSPFAKKALILKLPFDRSTFVKLVGIGNKYQRLHVVSGQLPQKFSVLYELSKFDDQQFDLALRSGAIHPAVTRQDVLGLAATSGSIVRSALRSARSTLKTLRALWAKTSEVEREQFKAWCDHNTKTH